MSPVEGSAYSCTVTLVVTVSPARTPVSVGIMRRLVSEQLPLVMSAVAKRAVALDSTGLLAGGRVGGLSFYPALEISSVFYGAEQRRRREAERKKQTSYLGLSEVSLPFDEDAREKSEANNASASSAAEATETEPAADRKAPADVSNADVDDADASSSRSKWFQDESPSSPGECEVHLRRLDTDAMRHRRAVGAVLIDAPPDVTWRVLSFFEGYSSFVPHLAFSERVALPSSVSR